MIRMRAKASPEWKAFARRLRNAPPEMRRNLRKRLREEGQAMVGGVQRAALDLPDGPPPKSTGIRAATAAATRLSITQNGIKVVVSQRRMGDQAFFPRAAEQGSWRHPVYGGPAWVTQTSKGGWFTGECKSHTPALRAAVEKAIDDTIEYLD